jgi:hypothetical protein
VAGGTCCSACPMTYNATWIGNHGSGLRVAISSRSRCSYPSHDRKGAAHLRSSALALLSQVPSTACAKLAHGMAGGGSRDDFSNPEFVQEWPCFIFYVLNMDPQVSGIQVEQVFFICTYTNLSLSTLCTWNPTTSGSIMRSALQVSKV